MAISLNSDGLSLNYPTSVQSSGVNVPVGCAVAYRNSTGSNYYLNGTWAMFYHNNEGKGQSEVSTVMIGKSYNAYEKYSYYALAIRVA